jgi:antitoxin HicB
MGAMAAREDIRAPKSSAADYVTLPALASAKIALYQAMRAEGVGKAALAKRLDVALPQIDRLLDLRHSSRLDAIERAFAALGREMEIVVNAAA